MSSGESLLAAFWNLQIDLINDELVKCTQLELSGKFKKVRSLFHFLIQILFVCLFVLLFRHIHQGDFEDRDAAENAYVEVKGNRKSIFKKRSTSSTCAVS